MTTSAHAHVWNDAFRSSAILKDQTSNQTFDLQIRNKHCLQTHGTTVGTRMAPSYANLFLAKFETDALSSAPFQPFIWWRYKEDIFVIWTRSVQDLNTFTSFLNDIHPTIKFTCDYSFTSIYSRCQRLTSQWQNRHWPLHQTYRQTPILTTFVMSSHKNKTCYFFSV